MPTKSRGVCAKRKKQSKVLMVVDDRNCKYRLGLSRMTGRKYRWLTRSVTREEVHRILGSINRRSIWFQYDSTDIYGNWSSYHGWSYVGEDYIALGCCRFHGVNAKKIRKWAFGRKK
jgi:hypothetical protein